MSKEVICECGEKIPEWYLRQKECSGKEYACCQCWDGEDQVIDSGFCRCGGCGMC